MTHTRKPRLGIALGSGSARGWAHIGVLRGLEQAGIVPDVVSGASIGALVGAAYASNRLDRLEEWVAQIDWWEIIRYMDLRLGGVEGERLMRAFRERVEDAPIETLPKPFGAVATDLQTGREVWFQEGSLLEAVRASIALPGLFSPVRHQDRWLVDGGLVDPLPVSLCRALGADRREVKGRRRYTVPANSRWLARTVALQKSSLVKSAVPFEETKAYVDKGLAAYRYYAAEQQAAHI